MEIFPRETMSQSLLVQEGFVFLKCCKVGSKLRVKILTNGYYQDANCQFPRDIRQDGLVYRVPTHAIKLVQSRGRAFYSVKQKHNITIVEKQVDVDLSTVTVYEDTTITECAVCYDAPKSTVFIPCGHFYTCVTCANKCTKCPICRETVTQTIDKSLVD